MDIVKESIDDTNAVIKVKITPTDYKPAVDKTIKDYQKKATIPGFRPGMVPMSVINQRFGKSILADEINQLLSDSLQKYIRDNELVPDKEFEFAFEVGLVPDFKVPLSADHKFTLLQVAAEDALIDEYIEEMRLRYDNLTHPEVSGEEDMLVGDFVELDEKGEILPGGIFKAS